MTNVGTVLGTSLVPPNEIGCVPGEGTQNRINMSADKENAVGQEKERGGEWRSNTGLWPLCSPIFSVNGCAAILGQILGVS